MLTARPRLAALALLAATACAPGCGSGSPAPPPPASAAEGLKEVAEVYRYLASEKKPPPAKFQDLEPYRDTLQHSWDRLEKGELVLVWRVGYSTAAGAGKGVLGYEKDAPSKGGAVLLRDGTVKEMTAAEFQAAKGAR
jgi:hypothetical protein